MTSEQFIATWKNNTLTERAGAQAHFDDLCDLLGVEKPRDPDNYCFERGAKKSGGGDGWADVWKRGCFGWENKKPGRDLDAALKQLTDYALQLENPPLLVVSDRERIIIHTAFTGYPDEPREIRIEELINPANLQLLRWVFTDPIKLRPEKSTAAITEEAAGHFAALAKTMRGRGLDGQQVAHFLVQCLFCMFAEDEQLLPANIFTDLLKNAGADTAKAGRRISTLFTAMQQSGGEYGDHDIAWFNGGLFKTVDVPTLTVADLTALYAAAATMDWRAIDPTIFGTLFERGLDPSARAPLGAHYTDTATIAKLITPLITEPLLAEWQTAKAVIAAGYDKKPGSKAYKEAQAAYSGFLARLNRFQVLDPACGSGNFLYLALIALRDVEKLAHLEAQEFGFEPQLLMQTGPHNIRGIEINEYAAELARVTVWIGDIQWCRRNGREIARNPILRALDGIEHRDALIGSTSLTDRSLSCRLSEVETGVEVNEATWPAADVIIGNPPFLGQRFMLRELGEMYTLTLRKCYEGRVSGAADLVTYWLEKARAQIEAGKTNVAGFVTTNSIRGGANQLVLARICHTTRIFTAWSDEEWINEGAAVRVSIICFGNAENTVLDGNAVSLIHADLTAGLGLDLTQAQRLPENSGVAFSGFQMNGSFDVSTETALEWLNLPNPNGKSNADVLHPYANAKDITSRSRNQWVIDFTGISEKDAALYEKPFEWITNYVKPERDEKREEYLRLKWWLHKRSSPELRKAIKGLKRFIATPMVSKYRLFVWLPEVQLPENAAIVFARNDDTTFGILHSRIHEIWSLKMCTWMGKGNDPRYTPTTCFETFPFPTGLQTETDEAIAAAAVTLNQLRENWLNPPEWVDWVITPQEEKAGFSKRPVAKPGHEAELKKRTLTNLYNARPAWLDNAHKTLDKAVAAAYGWADCTPEMADNEILSRLLALNLERAQGTS
jgi:type II restriction/modification system DNA methylase subunit YeeA